MSISVTTDVFCNGCNEMCWEWGCTEGRQNIPSARRQVKSIGWSYSKGKDYCPECTERRAHPERTVTKTASATIRETITLDELKESLTSND